MSDEIVDPFAEPEDEYVPVAPGEVGRAAPPEEPSLPVEEGEPLDPDLQAAFEEAVTLGTEELPPLTDEPLAQVIQAYAEKGRKARTPEPSLENAKADPMASGLLEAWGEEAFLGSAYYRLWQAEWRHQCMRDEIIERQGERKTRK